MKPGASLVSALVAVVIIAGGLGLGSSFFTAAGRLGAEPGVPVRAGDPAVPMNQLSPARVTPIPPGLLESEKNTIEVFRSAGGSVVYVTNNALRRDRFSTNVTEVPQGTGSGFLWDHFGHVVTNYHVIQNGQTFSVTLADGTTHEARVVGIEPRKDLAVLHFDTTGLDLKPLPVGRSETLLVGQKVLAIGNPFGLDRTLTTGIISALGREFPTQDGFVIEDVIQTDASINPGNSGGPLLDSAGRLIGVTTAIYSPSGSSAGIGFAVPVDTVSRIIPELIRYGQVKRAGLGVSVIPDHIVRSWGIKGVVIREVFAGSQAARSGLESMVLDRRGNVLSADIVTAVNGQPIDGFASLANTLEGKSPGDKVDVTVVRGKRTLTIQVQLMEIGR